MGIRISDILKFLDKKIDIIFWKTIIKNVVISVERVSYFMKHSKLESVDKNIHFQSIEPKKLLSEKFQNFRKKHKLGKTFFLGL